MPENGQNNPHHSRWTPHIKKIIILALERSGITNKGAEFIAELEVVVKKAPVCLTIVICFAIFSFIDGCRKSSEISRLSKTNESQSKIIEINSATAQNAQMQIQELNERILELLRDDEDVKRQRDRIEDWIMNRSTNALPAFFTYSGTNIITVTNFLPTATVPDRILNPIQIEVSKAMFGPLTNVTIMIFNTKDDPETFALAAQIKSIFTDMGLKIAPISSIAWQRVFNGIIVAANKNLVGTSFEQGFVRMNQGANPRILFDVETNMQSDNIAIYVGPQ